jgi:hypothetical protein
MCSKICYNTLQWNGTKLIKEDIPSTQKLSTTILKIQVLQVPKMCPQKDEESPGVQMKSYFLITECATPPSQKKEIPLPKRKLTCHSLTV